MNIHTASNFDIERFRKVYALVTGGATEGETRSGQGKSQQDSRLKL